MATGRRATDVDPSVQVWVEERLGETRHLLRNEAAEANMALSIQIVKLTEAVTSSALQSTKEHAVVESRLTQLSEDVRPLIGKVADLEKHDAAGDANRLLIRWMVGTAVALAGVVVAAVALLPHS